MSFQLRVRNPWPLHQAGLCLTLFAAIVISVAACSPAPPPRPDVILISVDTLRADALDPVAARAPVWQKLRDGGVRFRAAASPTPLTLPAHVSLLSGRDPNRHGIRNNGQVLDTHMPLVAERFAQAGYATAAVVSAFVLDAQFGLARGFQHYDHPQAQGALAELGVLERRAEDSVRAAQRWLEASPGPSFLWLHVYDPHLPYAAPGSDATAEPRTRYFDEVAYVGQALQPLIDTLDRRGRPYVLVLVGDHGEGLGEHGEVDHGLLLYDSTMLVPMIWYAPERWQPRVIEQTARLIDVAPTLLAVLQLPPLPDTEGVNLSALIATGKGDVLPAYAETEYPRLAYGYDPLRSVREGAWKYLGTERESELYRIDSDPGENHDLAAAETERVLGMQYDAWQRPEPERAGATSTDARVLEQLRSLGYLNDGAANGRTRGHPRAVIATHRRLVEIQELQGQGQRDEALAQAQELAVAEPENPFVPYVIGAMQLERGDLDAAIAALSDAVRLDPANAQAHYKLGETLMRVSRHAEALPHWQALQALSPTRTAAWTNQAAALAALGRWDEAWIAIAHARAQAPDDVTVLDNAAAIAEKLERWSDAADATLAIANTSGADFSARGRLALLLARAGRDSEATQWAQGVASHAADYGAVLIARALIAQRATDDAAARAALAELVQRQPRAREVVVREFPQLATLLP
jgi:arylsulfatase A-like enzyme/Flp pilus assembly protein TadD